MSRYDTSDLDTNGQISLEEYLSEENQLIAVSKIFARAKKEMNLAEQKTFTYALTLIRFKDKPKTTVIPLNKKRLADILKIKSDSNHLSVNLYEAIKNLSEHSHIEITQNDRLLLKNNGDQESTAILVGNGHLISNVFRYEDNIILEFSETYMRLFTRLLEDKNFITMWAEDIFSMKSSRSVDFYEHLRVITDTRNQVNDVLISVKTFKEMFNIPKEGKGSYVRKDGHFDRNAFEKQVIQPLCDDLVKCKMLNLVLQPDGKYYVKEKRGNRVQGYRFFWTFTSHPAIATAAEVKKLQDRVDKNPVVLKVAKDIVSGKPKPEKEKSKKKPTGTKFNNCPEREYDFNTLESDLLNATVTRNKESDDNQKGEEHAETDKSSAGGADQESQDMV